MNDDKLTSIKKDASRPLNRRAFFERALLLGAAVGAGAWATGCKGDPAATPSKAPAKQANCDDLSGLTPQQLSTRKSLQYVDVSPKPEQNCANCKIFVKKEPCPGCTVVPGPVKPAGWCTAWQPMT